MAAFGYSFILVSFILLHYTNAGGYNFYPEIAKYYKFYREPKVWYDAKLTCEADNASLVMPRGHHEVEVLKDIFKAYPATMLPHAPQPDNMLIGFHDKFQEGEFISVYGEPLQYFYHIWSRGQPDNSFEEDCVSLHRNGKLNDFSCTVPSVFVCQKGESHHDLLEPDGHCSTNDIAYKYSKNLDKCYKIHLQPKKWPEARAICFSEGGYLAVIRNKHEEDHLVELFNDPYNAVPYAQDKEHALIGFHDQFKEGYFETVTNENLHDVGYVNWEPGNPDNRFNNENCGSISKKGALNDISCSVTAVFICEQPASVLHPQFTD